VLRSLENIKIDSVYAVKASDHNYCLNKEILKLDPIFLTYHHDSDTEMKEMFGPLPIFDIKALH